MGEFQEGGSLEDVFYLLKKNLNAILCAVIAAAVIVGIFMYVRRRGVERELTARTMLEEGKGRLRENETAEGIEHLRMVIEDYGKTGAFCEALLYRGRASVGAGDYEEAIGFLNKYIETCSGGFLPEAYSELGFIYEEKGDFEKAERYYSLIFREFPQHYLAPGAMIDSARCFRETGDAERAAALYESLTAIYPWSSFVEAAAAKLHALDASGQ